MSLKVTGALAWWNELPKDLEACIEGIGQIADKVVAVDGAYRRYPGATVTSSDAEVAAIRRAAKKAGIECVIIQPDKLWAGQVEKRTFLLREAAKDSDWIVVVDADHIVHTDRVAARGALEAMPAKVNQVMVDFATPLNDSRPLSKSAATNWHIDMTRKTFQLVHIVRAYPNLRVEKKHWIYVATLPSGAEIEMRYGATVGTPLGVPYLVEHMTLFRTEEQILAGRAFCNDREAIVRMSGQEDDLPELNLPPPVFDFETLTYAGVQIGKVQPRTAAKEEEPVPMIRYRPPLPWSQAEPNRVLTLGEAARGLEKGYRVATRLRGNGLAPEIPNGDVIVLEPGTKSEPGSVVLAKVRHDLVVERVNADGRLEDKRGKVLREPKAIYGVLTYHGPHWPEPKAEKLTEGKPPKPETAKAAPVAAPKKKPGRPKGSGRKAVVTR